MRTNALAFLDCCVPCYFQGTKLPCLVIDVLPSMRVWQVKQALHSEVAAYGFNHLEEIADTYPLHCAVEEYFRHDHPLKVWHPAKLVEKYPDDEAYQGDSVQAYFGLLTHDS